jgi:hypothetical protein
MPVYPGAQRIIANALTDKCQQVQFRTEVFNIFNHPQHGLPEWNDPSYRLGSITSTVNTTTPVSPVGEGTPREFQFALRLQF